MKNQGIPNTRQTSAVKWYATDASANEAIQVHGAYGFSDEYHVERFLQNAKGAVIYVSSNEIQRLIQASYAFGWLEDQPLRKEMPIYNEVEWQEE